MSGRLNRARPLVAAWIFAATLVLASVATALAGDGGVPYAH